MFDFTENEPKQPNLFVRLFNAIPGFWQAITRGGDNPFESHCSSDDRLLFDVTRECNSTNQNQKEGERKNAA